jgi:LysR family transcriptional regulator of abg operon
VRLSQLKELIAVVQTGSLRAAARSLGVSQPAITKSIRQLEDELQVQLLARSGRGAVATRAGKAVLARARVVHAELKKIEEDLQELQGGGAGSIVIGVSPAASVQLVPEALVRFRRRYPDASVRLVEGMSEFLLPMVRDASLDFAIGAKPVTPLDSAIRFKPLHVAHFVIVGRRGHPLRGAKSLRDLAQVSWVTFAAPGRNRILLGLYAAADLPPPKIAVGCETYTTALAVLASTDALGLIVPQLLAERYTHGFLEQIRIAEPVPSITIGLFSRTDAPLAPAASEMAAAVTAVARRLARRR